MAATLQMVLSWAYPIVSIILIVLVSTRKELKGRIWLLTHLIASFIVTMMWRIPALMSSMNMLESSSITRFYDWFGIPLKILSFASFCLLIPYVITASDNSDAALKNSPPPQPSINPGQRDTADLSNPLYGVKGWLKFIVIVNMYIAPVIFVLRYIVAWISFVALAERYPGIIIIGLIETCVGGFIIYKWICIARGLRDIQPGIIQEAKTWLKISLGWTILSIPLVFMSGIDAEFILPGSIKSFIGGIIGFSVWYAYFTHSKRVKATYVDWDR